MTTPDQTIPPTCQGTNCGVIDGQNHSPECIVDAAKTQGWADAPEAVEAAIQAETKFEAYYVTDADVTRAIVTSDFHVFPGTTVTVCLLTLPNGARVIGHNYGSIDPARQDWQKGRQAAYDMAREKVWELLGYELRCKLAAHQQGGAA